MVSEAILIAKTDINFDVLAATCGATLPQDALATVNRTSRKVSDPEKFLLILSDVKDGTTKPNLYCHVSYSFIVLAEDYDLIEILEFCSGMPFIQSETTRRGTSFAIVTGTLAQWRDAVVSGSQSRHAAIFNKIHNIFVGMNLQHIWSGYKQEPNGKNYQLIKV